MFERSKESIRNGEDFLKRAASDAEVGSRLEVLRLVDSTRLSVEALPGLLLELEADGYLCREAEAEAWHLTEKGWQKGRQLLRAHRVYESYLAESTGIHPAEWHAEADRYEHLLDVETVDRMADELNHPRFDPHGDAIPTRELDMEEPVGDLLSRVVEQGWYWVVHLEDEPREPFERNIQAGLAPELLVHVTVLEGGRYLLHWAGLERFLDAAQAAGCLVRPCQQTDAVRPAGNLCALEAGREVSLHSISPAVMGLQRRRLLDLGFVPGSRVMKEGAAAFGGPMRYRVRGTSQALRPDLAEKIFTIESGGSK